MPSAKKIPSRREYIDQNWWRYEERQYTSDRSRPECEALAGNEWDRQYSAKWKEKEAADIAAERKAGWSREWPTAPGWYWALRGDFDPEPVRVLVDHRKRVSWVFGGREHTVRCSGVLWGKAIRVPSVAAIRRVRKRSE